MAIRERGDGKLSLFIFLALIAGGIFFLVKWVPPRVNAYEFKDEMGKWNTDPDYRMRRASADVIRTELLKRAHELNLPISSENLEVSTSGDGTIIVATFDIPIDLKITTVTQHYEFHEPKT